MPATATATTPSVRSTRSKTQTSADLVKAIGEVFAAMDILTKAKSARSTESREASQAVVLGLAFTPNPDSLSDIVSAAENVRDRISAVSDMVGVRLTATDSQACGFDSAANGRQIGSILIGAIGNPSSKNLKSLREGLRIG